jgi:hypothetical protein
MRMKPPHRTGSMIPGVAPWALDPEAAERLWTMSEQAIG